MRRHPKSPTAGALGIALLMLLTAPSPVLAQTPTTTPPTTTPPTTTPPTPPETSSSPSPHPPGPQRAEVTYSGGILSVRASNSSLNQILRDISRQTGMKITGGVTDDRVFGVYGPASPSEVIRALLDGTQSNMLLVENGQAAPKELILTPRTGGVTPPNPNTYRDEPASAQSFPQPVPPPSTPNPEQGQVRPNDEAPSTAASSAAPGSPAQGPNAPPAAQPGPGSPATGTDQQSPNGVKTPQQIFEQLQKLRNQQSAQPQ